MSDISIRMLVCKVPESLRIYTNFK